MMRIETLVGVLSRFGFTFSPDHQDVVELLDRLNRGQNARLALTGMIDDPSTELLDALQEARASDALDDLMNGGGTGTGAPPPLPVPAPNLEQMLREANDRADGAERQAREEAERVQLAMLQARANARRADEAERLAEELKQRAHEANRTVGELEGNFEIARATAGKGEGLKPLVIAIAILLIALCTLVVWWGRKAPSTEDNELAHRVNTALDGVNFSEMDKAVHRIDKTVAVTLRMQVPQKDRAGKEICQFKPNSKVCATDSNGNDILVWESVPVPSLGDVHRIGLADTSEAKKLVVKDGVAEALREFELRKQLDALDRGLRRANDYIAPKPNSGEEQDRVVRLSDYAEGGTLAQPPAEEEDSADAAPASPTPTDAPAAVDPAPPADGEGEVKDETPGPGASAVGTPCLRLGVGDILPDGPCVPDARP